MNLKTPNWLMFTQSGKGILIATLAAALLPLSACKKTAPKPVNPPNAAQASPEEGASGTTDATRHASPTPDSPRFAIQQGCVGFADREAVIEVTEARKHAANPTDEEAALTKIRLRQEGEGRRIDFARDYVVRIVTKDDETKFYEVEALNPIGLKKPRFWVHKSILQGANSLSGSQIITGYTIFRGRKGTDVDDTLVRNLLDLIAGIYEGTISEESASKCVFMTQAQQNQEDICDVEAIQGDYVVYRAAYYRSYAPNRTVRFAMPREGNNKPLQSGPVRFIGRKQFTTKSGIVLSLPVFAVQKGIE